MVDFKLLCLFVHIIVTNYTVALSEPSIADTKIILYNTLSHFFEIIKESLHIQIYS